MSLQHDQQFPKSAVDDARRYAEVLRIVSETVTEANDSGGIDLNDLVTRLEERGHGLPDVDGEPADAQAASGCTATLNMLHCLQHAGHYNEAGPFPSSWHRGITRSGSPMSWSDDAVGATPHGAPPQPLSAPSIDHALERIEQPHGMDPWWELAHVLLDLDRCEHGSHEGDPCGSCNGLSKGNPHMPPGSTIGYSLCRSPIVMPHSNEKHNSTKWYTTTPQATR